MDGDDWAHVNEIEARVARQGDFKCTCCLEHYLPNALAVGCMVRPHDTPTYYAICVDCVSALGELEDGDEKDAIWNLIRFHVTLHEAGEM